MPCRENASYPAWKIWFEKIFPYLNEENIIIVAHSLGGIFISKYLSENAFPKHLAQLHLVAPVLDDE
jgi:predicted alpha/beta hydrolase family esterase